MVPRVRLWGVAIMAAAVALSAHAAVLSDAQAKALQVAALHGNQHDLQQLRLAAISGEASAQAFLGVYDAVKLRNYPLAAYWYRKATAQGNADAELYLGYAHAQGQGVPQN